MVNNSSVLKALIYSDIFNYPLRKEEIWKFIIGKISRKSFEGELKNLSGVGFKNNFYYLWGRSKIIEKRIERKKESQRKLITAKIIARIFSLVPTVLLIGISGGLAMENAEEKDDIDLFVIVSRGNIWITRLILIFLLILMGRYRRREKKESNKVCLNMLIGEEALAFPKSRNDLYTAHEIIQMRPVFERKNTYKRFLSANKWVLKYLPNGIRIEKERYEKVNKSSQSVLEVIAKIIQLWYMKKHITSETIQDYFLAFHPYEYKYHVLKEYNKRLRKYSLV